MVLWRFLRRRRFGRRPPRVSRSNGSQEQKNEGKEIYEPQRRRRRQHYYPRYFRRPRGPPRGNRQEQLNEEKHDTDEDSTGGGSPQHGQEQGQYSNSLTRCFYSRNSYNRRPRQVRSDTEGSQSGGDLKENEPEKQQNQ
ncbi:uncharacterized protein LOC143227809 isoform X2 [Tachypleus tridentatus]|uniref:uncharacterized protein LOC143227809 isoform X2 n=1 Tax=Tachypleus tridentatus TaxID=6853 RepID=UPI003FD426A0